MSVRVRLVAKLERFVARDFLKTISDASKPIPMGLERLYFWPEKSIFCKNTNFVVELPAQPQAGIQIFGVRI